MAHAHSRRRIRDVIPGIRLGNFQTGRLNSITDVSGVLVHTQSIREPSIQELHEINSGVTVILPRRRYWESACHAGIFRFNGAGELTGSHWLKETGLLMSPIVITGTFGIGAAHEGVVRHFIRQTRNANGLTDMFSLPVIAETWDGYLSDAAALPVRPDHIVHGIDEAHSGPVSEGNTGGGTGMICHGFKGGTGCASRMVLAPDSWTRTMEEQHSFTLGVLVQANYGRMKNLRIGGVPVGLKFAEDRAKAESNEQPPTDGSIIIVIATDAPLSPIQLQRLAKRGTVGLARVGGIGYNYSGSVASRRSTSKILRRLWPHICTINPQMLIFV